MRKLSDRQMRRAAKTQQRREEKRRRKLSAVALRSSAASRPAALAGSPSLDLPADKLALLRSVDGYADLRGRLGRIAEFQREWAGIPMPIEGTPLVIEPTYPHAKELAIIGQKPDEDEPDGAKHRNTFWSWRWRCHIAVYEHEGKIGWGRTDASNHLGEALGVLSVADAWGIEQEQKALKLLGTLVKHRAFKQYLLAGMFIETSKRSGVSYIFRRLRPTLALRPGKDGESMRILCALCLHPIAYYAGTWAGAMCPTDDVVAHLMLMRGDEPMFWRRANQHPPFVHQAGI